MTDKLIAVTGATGGIGGRVAARLAQRGVRQRLVVRDRDRAPSLDGAEVLVSSGYSDADAMRAALDGVHTLLFVSAGETEDRVGVHRSALEAAVAAGVAHIVYLSVVGAGDPKATFTLVRDHHATEEALRGLPVAHTMVRDSLYLDFLAKMVGADGVIRGPAGKGKLGGVARDDVADALVAILTGDGHEGAIYELTGPESISFQEAAEIMSAASGKAIGFYNEPLQEAFESRMDPDVEDWMIDAWVTTYLAVARGEFDLVTDDVQQLTGHAPAGLAEVLGRYPDSLNHVTAT
ncbi:MAG: nucleoside-diphosphate sugar epimerase [Solirubrobacterales bacterium]|nr:nucleoside-diphosphate sugar epimerase [Solirubrobacterales bacterium]